MHSPTFQQDNKDEQLKAKYFKYLEVYNQWCDFWVGLSVWPTNKKWGCLGNLFQNNYSVQCRNDTLQL